MEQPIADETEYAAALAELSRLMDLPDDAPEASQLEPLAARVQAYEDSQYPEDPIRELLK